MLDEIKDSGILEKNQKSNLRELLGNSAILEFRQILYSPFLTFGARLFIFAVWDLPSGKGKVNLTSIAKRLNVTVPCVFKWRKEAKNVNFRYFKDLPVASKKYAKKNQA